MRRLAVVLLAFSLLAGSGCTNTAEVERDQLRQENASLRRQVASLEWESTKLRETDTHYYHRGIELRRAKKYQESSKALREMVQKFPTSRLVAPARAAIAKNQVDLAAPAPTAPKPSSR